jgi:uncharacterized membrane protein YvlD (DUF360 family)
VDAAALLALAGLLPGFTLDGADAAFATAAIVGVLTSGRCLLAQPFH